MSVLAMKVLAAHPHPNADALPRLRARRARTVAHRRDRQPRERLRGWRRGGGGSRRRDARRRHADPKGAAARRGLVRDGARQGRRRAGHRSVRALRRGGAARRAGGELDEHRALPSRPAGRRGSRRGRGRDAAGADLREIRPPPARCWCARPAARTGPERRAMERGDDPAALPAAPTTPTPPPTEAPRGSSSESMIFEITQDGSGQNLVRGQLRARRLSLNVPLVPCRPNILQKSPRRDLRWEWHVPDDPRHASS